MLTDGQAVLLHASGLTACDAVRMLVHLDKLRPILPGIQTRTDALLVLRNLDTLEQCDSMETLKENLLQTDDRHAHGRSGRPAPRRDWSASPF